MIFRSLTQRKSFSPLNRAPMDPRIRPRICQYRAENTTQSTNESSRWIFRSDQSICPFRLTDKHDVTILINDIADARIHLGLEMIAKGTIDSSKTPRRLSDTYAKVREMCRSHCFVRKHHSEYAKRDVLSAVCRFRVRPVRCFVHPDCCSNDQIHVRCRRGATARAWRSHTASSSFCSKENTRHYFIGRRLV